MPKSVRRPKKKPAPGKPVGVAKPKSAQAQRDARISRPPAAKGSVVKNTGATFNGRKSFVVSHREYLETITAQPGETFLPVTYIIQPASLDNYPWLSTIAQNFEEYRIRKMAFVFRSRCPTTTTGRIICVTSKDSADSKFLSASVMQNYQGAEVFNVWENLRHDCLLYLGDYMKKYFTLTDGNDPGSSPQVYNVGKFSFCANGDAVVVSDLFVEYEVELFIPKSQNLIPESMTFQSQFQGTLGNPVSSVTYVESTFPVQNSMAFSAFNLSPYVRNATGDTYRVHLPMPGKYLVFCGNVLSDQADSGENPMVLVGATNCTANILQSLSNYVTIAGVGYTSNVTVFYINVTQADQPDAVYATLGWNEEEGKTSSELTVVATLLNPKTDTALTLDSKEAIPLMVPPTSSRSHALISSARAGLSGGESKAEHMERKIRKLQQQPPDVRARMSKSPERPRSAVVSERELPKSVQNHSAAVASGQQ